MAKENLIIFDIDETLLPGQSQLLLLKFLRQERIVPLWYILRVYIWFIFYRIRILENPKKIMEYAFQFLKGKTEKEVVDIMKNFFNQKIRPILYKDALLEIERHKKNTNKIVILSNVIEPLAKIIAMEVGIEIVISTKPEINNGVFTGKLLNTPVYGEEKAKKLLEFVNKNNLSLSNSWAYCDHGSDIPVLKLVGYPVAINPDKKLSRVARENGWKIMLFKK